MNLTRKGVRFEYHGDELLWIWPWKRTKPSLNTIKYYSYTFDDYFFSLRDYWLFVGSWNEACRKEKIIGYNDNEVFKAWAEHTFRHNTVVILRNVNVEMRSTLFWRSLDPLSRKQLLKDVPVLFFHDSSKAQLVAESVDPEFADVFFFMKGKLKYTNNEKYEIDFGEEQETHFSDYAGPQ
jgi:hypothetical protein